MAARWGHEMSTSNRECLNDWIVEESSVFQSADSRVAFDTITEVIGGLKRDRMDFGGSHDVRHLHKS